MDALVRQAGRLWNVHDSATTDRARLGELLAELLPTGLDTYCLLSTGAEVVEAALRVVAALAPPGRNRIAALRHGFHGKTLGARMLVHWDIGHQSFAGNSVLGYSTYCYRCPLDLQYPSCGTALRRPRDPPHRRQAQRQRARVRARPRRGRRHVPPSEYWPKIAEACRENGVLLVADEVLTGGGRTGEFLGCTWLGIEPDLMLLAKGMASGFPFAVLAGRADVLRRPEIAAAGSTASTFGGNPLGIAVALATVTVLARDNLIARVAELGAVVADGLAPLRDRCPMLGDIRGVACSTVWSSCTTRRPATPPPDLAREVYQAALDLGPRTALGNVLRLAPPFTIERAELERGIALLDRALARVAEAHR